MADIGTTVAAYLRANAGVTALVGTRIYPEALPQGYSVSSGGAVTYAVVSTIHDHMINGLAGIARTRIEFTSFASSCLAASAISEAIRSSGLVGYVGVMGTRTIESVMITDSDQHGIEPPTDGTQEHRYFTVSDFLIAHQEST